MKIRATQAIMECLLEQEVDTIFGYPGGTILNLYDELYRYQDKITHVLTAHEQGASHAADGYARSTGKVGVCFATSGPGATNLTTGIATAYMDSIPMVAITGQVPSHLLGRDIFQEVDITGAVLNMDRFEAAYQVLSASMLELTEFETTYVAGSIDCDRDGLLYTSIPQNGNWSVKVDGKAAETVLTGDVMVGVLLSEGEHEVEFIYHNKAFAWGWKISLLCAAIFGALVYLDRKKNPHGGKYKKG